MFEPCDHIEPFGRWLDEACRMKKLCMEGFCSSLQTTGTRRASFDKSPRLLWGFSLRRMLDSHYRPLARVNPGVGV